MSTANVTATAATPTKVFGPGDDREFLLTPTAWRRWPFAPVKRVNKTTTRMELGLIIAMEGQTTTVYIANLFENGDRVGELRKDFIDNPTYSPDKGTKYVYNTIDELLADGWVVD